MHPTILIMIDGVSAGYVQEHRARIPNLAALAGEGLQVRALAADVPATSLPGRTSIVTGVGAEVHGIYGNLIRDGGRFRYANPDDVRVPTLPRRAKDAGRSVAVLGYGMVRPEDAHVFHHAWWVGEMLQRARDFEPIPADEGWLRTVRHRDPSGRMRELSAQGLPSDIADAYAGDRAHYLLGELSGDRTMLEWTAGLGVSADPPDLVLTEILAPDTIQHAAGQGHPFSHFAIGYADDLVGSLVARLARAGRLDRTNLVLVSDHGHGPVDRVLYADRLLPERACGVEGSFLYVPVEGPQDAADAEAALRPHGVRRLANHHLPEPDRHAVATFLAPDGTAFEGRAPQGAGPAGLPRTPSGHGFRPGHPADARFLIARGPDVPRGVVASAASDAVEAFVARLVGVEPYGGGRPLYDG